MPFFLLPDVHFFSSAKPVGLNVGTQEKLGAASSDSLPDMNEQNDQNDGDGGYRKQPDSDGHQPGSES